LILTRDVYATAAFVTGVVFVATTYVGASEDVALIGATAAGFAVRGLAIVYDWSLPPPRVRKNQK